MPKGSQLSVVADSDLSLKDRIFVVDYNAAGDVVGTRTMYLEQARRMTALDAPISDLASNTVEVTGPAIAVTKDGQLVFLPKDKTAPDDNASWTQDALISDLVIAGFDDIAPAAGSIVRGDGTKWVAASNLRADAGTEGSGTEMGGGSADGLRSVAEGNGTEASGDDSHAEGNGTTASAFASHAEGFFTTASGSDSHAEGFESTASAFASHAEGYSTEASGDVSHAAGRRAKAIHDGARVEADSQDADVSSTSADQFTARFQNGYEFKGGPANFEDASGTRANLGLLSASDTLDFPSIPTQSSAELTVTVTGAAVGDAVQLAAPSTIEADLTWSGYVSAADTVTVRVVNATAGSIDPASATWGVIVTPIS